MLTVIKNCSALILQDETHTVYPKAIFTKHLATDFVLVDMFDLISFGTIIFF